MIISHKYKFIFFKTKKTAGTSIEVFLSKHCENYDIVTPINPQVESHRAQNYKGFFNPLPEIMANGVVGVKVTSKLLAKFILRMKFYNHIPAYRVRETVPAIIWDNYFKFCVERNPWDKTLSHYYMLKHRKGGKLSFDKYLSKGDFCLNYPIYTDRDGKKIIVNKVVRYENLLNDLNFIFKDLGIPFEGTLYTKAKATYRKDRRPYQEVFTNEQKQIIEKAFGKEIRMHVYNY